MTRARALRVLLGGVLLLTVLPVGSAPVRAAPEGEQDAPWVQEQPAHAPPAMPSVMAYHPPTERTVLLGTPFGLSTTVDPASQTWTWDGTDWHKEPAPSPTYSSDDPLAYHADSKKLVHLSQSRSTWTWDGTTWEDVTPDHPDSPCHEAGRASCTSPPFTMYMTEASDGTVTAFTESNGTWSEVWTWDGVSWTKNATGSPAPPVLGNERERFVYDAARRETVFVGPVPGDEQRTQTWTWGVEGWKQRHPEHGAPRDLLFSTKDSVAYHQGAEQVVAVGLERRSNETATWSWDGSDWAQRVPSTSPPMGGQAMAAHDKSGRIVLFSWRNGYVVDTVVPGETWTWDAAATSGADDTTSTKVKVTLEPDTLPADRFSRAVVKVDVTRAGQPVRNLSVTLLSDGDAKPTPSAREQEDGSYKGFVYAGTEPGTQTVTATASVFSPGLAPLARGYAVLTQVPAPECETEPAPPGPPRWTDLDPTFGCNGKVLPPFGYAADMAIRPNGNMVVAGSTIAQFRPDGSLDPAFGQGGMSDFPDLRHTGVWRVALQKDGRLLILGRDKLFRVTEDGSPDASFGPGKDGTVDVTGGSEPGLQTFLEGLAVQEDGKILLGGDVREFNFGFFIDHVKLARYNADGTPDDGGPSDTTPGDKFGDDGTVTTDVGGNGGAEDVAVQADGKILAGGWSGLDFVLVRYHPDGDLDRGFGSSCPPPTDPCGGVVTTTFADSTAVQRLVLQPDRKIVAVGHMPFGQGSRRWGFTLARYNLDGSLDSTFNPCPASPPCGGTVITDNFAGWEPRDADGSGRSPSDSGFVGDAVLQDDGKLVVGGWGPERGSDILVARYNADGTLDTCGTPGYVRTRIGDSAGAGAVEVDRQGRIVTAGNARGGTQGAALVRYRGGGGLGPRSLSVGGPAPVPEPTAGTAAAGFSVSLDAPACEEIKIDVATEQGSATPGQDYTPVSTTVSFGPGEQNKPLEVPVLSDDLPEHDEDFSLRLSNPRTAASEGPQGLVGPSSEVSLATSVAPATIVDSGGVVGIGDVAVAEPDSASVPAHFTVTLSGPAVAPVTVGYATSDATATAGADYQATSGTLTIPTGATTATVTVAVTGDTQPEPTENFVVELSDPGGARLGRAKGTGTILDAGPGISVGDATVVEGNAGTTPARFTVTLNAPPTQAVSVDYASAHQSAGAADYRSVSGRLDFAPGQRSQVLTVEVVADTLAEDDEAFTLSLSNPLGAALHRATGTGTILDDDEPPPPAGSRAPPLPDLGPTAPGLAAPAGSTPPPAPITQAQAQGQSQAQSQAQAQQQLQQQAQTQAQAQTQVQLQQQAQLQAQAQAQLQPGLMLDRERELQLEKARSGAGGRTTLAASARRQTVPATAMFVWAAALGAFVAALAGRHHTGEAAHIARLNPGRRRPKRRR